MEQFNKLGYFFNSKGIKSTEILPELKDFDKTSVVFPKKKRAAHIFFIKLNYDKFEKMFPGAKIT